MAAAVKGGRNDAVNAAAYSLGRLAHLDPAAAEAGLERVRAAASGLGLSPAEVRGAVRSGWESGRKNPARPQSRAPAGAEAFRRRR